MTGTYRHELKAHPEQGPDVLVLALHGELDLASAPTLDRELAGAYATAVKRLVIDLRGLQFMDSAGLHVLLSANERLHEDGRRLSLLRGPRAVQRVFELTRSTKLFQFDG